MTIKVRNHALFIEVLCLNFNLFFFASLDISDGEMSHCSSYEENPNDVTVLPRKSAAMDNGKDESTSETLIQKRKRVNKQRNSPLSSETCQTSPPKKKG
jgi:hypothetical protein